MASGRLSSLYAVGLAGIVLFICANASIATTTAYISLTGSPAWDGTCDGLACPADRPCSLPPTLTSVNASSVICILSIAAGDYRDTLQVQQLDSSNTLQIAFSTEDNGVEHLSLWIKATHAILKGKLAQSVVNVSLEVAAVVTLDGLFSNGTTFHYYSVIQESPKVQLNVMNSQLGLLPSTGEAVDQIRYLFVRPSWFLDGFTSILSGSKL